MSLPALKRRVMAPAIKVRWVLIVALLPVELLGLLAIGVQAYEWVRYEPGYFTPPFLERYAAPADTARLLETALQTGDSGLAAELQGLRRPCHAGGANGSLSHLPVRRHAGLCAIPAAPRTGTRPVGCRGRRPGVLPSLWPVAPYLFHPEHRLVGREWPGPWPGVDPAHLRARPRLAAPPGVDRTHLTLTQGYALPGPNAIARRD